MCENDIKLRHLDLIQSVISRQAANSFSIRGWAVTLVAAIIFLSAKDSNVWYFLVALLPTVVFWGLDGYYLRQERLFRKLYDKVRTLNSNELANNPFSLDTLPFTFPEFSQTLAEEQEQVKSWWMTCWSKTIGWLYGSMVITIIIVATIALICKQ